MGCCKDKLNNNEGRLSTLLLMIETEELPTPTNMKKIVFIIIILFTRIDSCSLLFMQVYLAAK